MQQRKSRLFGHYRQEVDLRFKGKKKVPGIAAVQPLGRAKVREELKHRIPEQETKDSIDN